MNGRFSTTFFKECEIKHQLYKGYNSFRDKNQDNYRSYVYVRNVINISFTSLNFCVVITRV